jgi:beta-lactamase regulating signal transducer with metallopeptidase domain
MKGIFGTVLALSLCGSIMILELLILKPLIRNRVTKAFQYYIWLVVILRLMMPFSSDINLFGATADIVRSKIEAVSALGNVSNQTQNDMASDTIKPEELTVPEKNSVAQNSETQNSTTKISASDNITTDNSMTNNNTSDNSVIDNSLTDKSTADYSSTDNSAAAVGLEKSIDTTDSVVAADKTASDSIQSNNIIKVITNNLWVIWLAGVFLALFRLFYQYYHFLPSDIQDHPW